MNNVLMTDGIYHFFKTTTQSTGFNQISEGQF